jgi:hypothetical protein
MRKKLSPVTLVRQDPSAPRPLVADVGHTTRLPTVAMLRLALAASVVGGALLTGCGVDGGLAIQADPIQMRAALRNRMLDKGEGETMPGVSPTIEPSPNPPDVDGDIASVKPVKPVPTAKPVPPPIGTVPTLGGAVAPVRPFVPPSSTTPKLAGKIAPTHLGSI